MKSIVLIVATALLPSIAAAESHDFQKGSAILDCTCTVGDCPLKPTHQPFTWSVSIFTPPGKLDLDQVCYHKQGSADSLGAVKCCDFGADKTPGAYTTGKVGKECPGVDDPKQCH